MRAGYRMRALEIHLPHRSERDVGKSETDWLGGGRPEALGSARPSIGSISAQPSRTLHAINGLARGGTESVLAGLLAQSPVDGNTEVTVVTLGLGDELIGNVQASGATVVELSKVRVESLSYLWEAVGLADVVCSWSYRTHLLFGMVCFIRRRRCVWFVRHAAIDLANNGWKTWLLIRAIAPMSYVASAISYNGAESKKNHESIGFARSNSSVAINSCDSDLYRPRPGQNRILKEELGLSADDSTPLVLSASRWHPIKDVAGFIEAAGQLKKMKSSFRAILCGRGLDAGNAELLRLIKEEGLEVGSDIFLLGLRDDLHLVMSAVHLYVLHSRSEAFPNTVLQAMSSGLRLVCTDVGGVRDITCGAVPVVPPGDVAALASEIARVLSLGDPQLAPSGTSLREMVRENYSTDRVDPQYRQLIEGGVVRDER